MIEMKHEKIEVHEKHILTLNKDEYSELKYLLKEILEFTDANILPPMGRIQIWSDMAYKLKQGLE